MKSGWMKLLVVAELVCAVGLTGGCKKKKPGAGGTGDDNIGGIIGSDVYGEGLGGRPGDDASYAEGQFQSVYFDYDSAQINPSERTKIEEVANNLRSNSQQGIVVEGHCDERGSNEYNLALGERRALAVRAYLIGLGVDGSRIQTKSYGEERPAVPGHDEDAWSRNRRAEFVLFY